MFICVSEHAASRARSKVERLEARGIVVLRYPAPGGVLNLRDVLSALYRFSIGSVLVEGGSSIFTQFLEERLVDELSIFVTPLMLGGGVPAFGGRRWQTPPFERSTGFRMHRTGKDVLFTTQFRQEK